MNPRRLLVPLLSFAAGAAIVFPWSGDSPSAGMPTGASSEKAAAAANITSGESRLDSTEITAEELALTGLSAPPSLEEVFQAAGLDRELRLALWLRTASSSEIRIALEGDLDPAMADENFARLVRLRWVEIDPKAALAAPNSYLSLRALAKTAPEAAVASALKASPFELRSVIGSIGEADPESAIALLRWYPQADDSVAWSGIMEGLCDRDPAAAAALALKNGIQFRQIMENWADRDNKAALAWAEKVEDFAERRVAVDAVIGRLITTDPAAALREAGRLPPGRLRSDLTLLAVDALGARNPEAAASAARALSNARETNLARLRLVQSLAYERPNQALSLLREAGQAGFTSEDGFTWRYVTDSGHAGHQGGGTGSVIYPALYALMDSSPVLTAELLVKLPSGANTALDTAMRIWAESDSSTASAWLDQQPPAPWKDSAIGHLIEAVGRGKDKDHEAALAWSLAATPARQVELATKALHDFHKRDPDGASAALEDLPFTSEQKAQIAASLR